jgi:hypothetical protein
LAIVEQVLTNRPKNPIQYKNNTDHRGYICGIGEVQAILGDVDLDAWTDALKPRIPKAKVERNDAWAMPQELREMGIKPGDIVLVRHGRGGLKEAVYTGYNSNRPKYPVSYEINGKGWKGTKGIITKKVRDGVEAAA